MRYLLIVPLLAIVANIEANERADKVQLVDKVDSLPPLHPSSVDQAREARAAVGERPKNYMSLMKEGRNQEALQVIDEMLAKNPNVQLKFVVQFAKARVLQKLNKTTLALEEALKAKKLAELAGMPSEPVDNLINNLGWQMDRMDNF